MAEHEWLADLPARDRDVRRFWSKVSLPDGEGCMRWLDSGRWGDGYGIFRVYDRGGKQRGTTSHRFSCFLAYGSPESLEMEAAHGCRTTDCVAPEHLYWATKSVNERDKLRDGTDPRGVKSAHAKLSESQALSIYRSDESYRTLADRFGISFTAVRKIKTGENWGWLTHA